MEEPMVEQFLAWEGQQVSLALELEEYERHLAAQGMDPQERRFRLERVRDFFRGLRMRKLQEA